MPSAGVFSKPAGNLNSEFPSLDAQLIVDGFGYIDAGVAFGTDSQAVVVDLSSDLREDTFLWAALASKPVPFKLIGEALGDLSANLLRVLVSNSARACELGP